MSPAAAPAALDPHLRVDIGSSVVGAVILLVLVGWCLWFMRTRRDEEYVGITPGERPADGTGRTRRVGGTGEWNGTVAVRFTPPDGVTPGIAGTVVDGRADHVDLSATIIDLAARGHLVIAAVRPEGASTGDASAKDPSGWELRRRTSDDPLRPYERHLLADLFAKGQVVRLTALRGTFQTTMRRAQIGLYREVVDAGWYRGHPQARNRGAGCLGMLLVPVGIVLALAGLVARHRGVADWPLMLPGSCLAVGGAILARFGRGRTPRTADGTAIRVQTLGFREYLTTAEADQVRFEEAADIFSRYLPYAIVFGCAQRWARIFGEVAGRAHLDGLGDAAFDLDWIDGIDLLVDLGVDVVRVVDAFDGPGLTDVGEGLGDLPDVDLVDTLGNGLSELAGGLGGFVESVGDMVDGLDGCGCDGCDLSF